VGKRLARLKPRTGFCVETGAASAILLATHLGLPVSTTHAIAGSLVGVGSISAGESRALGRGHQYSIGLDSDHSGVSFGGRNSIYHNPVRQSTCVESLSRRDLKESAPAVLAPRVAVPYRLPEESRVKPPYG
jgi:phosphate/sulfate permease